MGKTTGHLVWLAVLAGSIFGCVTTGIINGRLSVPGKPAVPVTFSYKSERFGEGGTISGVLPGGESFTGRYLQVTSTTTAESIAPFSAGWGYGWEDWGPWGDPWGMGADTTTFATNYSGKVVATLFGNKGSSMRCRFRLADPPGGMGGGGVGECQLSSGGRIDAQF